eukprot:symbB.v1.2.001768.t1/scaffold95.1/size600632/16
MTHVETAPAPTLDRTITEPLPAVQEEDLGEGHRLSPLMTPKASEANRQDEAFPQAAVYEAEAHLTDEVEAHQKEGGEDDAEGTTAPEELADEQGSQNEPADITDEAMPVVNEDLAVESDPMERRESVDSQDGEPRHKAKDTEKTTRLPLPTALMAATASAKRAEPPPMVVKPQPAQKELPAQPTHQLPAPDAYLKINPTAKEVGKLKELREFWGNKTSKGFAGPGLAGSRLSKVEAQATLQRLLIAGGDLDEVRRLRKIIAELEAA